MGKRSKVTPQYPHSIPPGKGGKPHGKRSQSTSLTIHSWVPLSSKFTGKISFFSKITANRTDFAHFAHSPCELCKIRYKIHPLYLNAFRFLTTLRELHGIGVNRTDFAYFANSSSKLREIC